MSSLGTATFDLKTDSSQFDKGLRGAEKSAEGFGGKVSGIFGGLAKVGFAAIGIKAVGSAVSGLASGMVAGNAEFERYETQFGVLLGSADKAKQRIAELSKFAATTPFELPEVVKAGKVLESFGLQGDKAMARLGKTGPQILQTIGDAAAGSGAKFDELALTFGKFASGATGESLARMQELGLTTREELASMGVAFSKGGELLTDKDKALGVVMQAVNKRFGGMMEKQSQTFEGMTSNLSDWMGQTKRKLMEPVFEVLKDKLGGLLTFLNDPGTMAAIEGFATKVAGGISAALEGIGALADLAKGAFETIRNAFQGEFTGDFTEAWARVFGQEAPGGLVAFEEIASAGFAHLGDIVRQAMSGDLGGALKSVVAGYNDMRELVITTIVDALPGITSALMGWAKAAVAWLTDSAIPMLKAELPKYLSGMLSFISGNLDKVIGVMLSLGREFFAWVPKAIPPLLTELLGLLTSMLQWLGDNSEQIGAKLVEWGLKFGEFIFKTAIPAILTNLPGILLTIGTWVLTEGIPGVVRIALGLGKGILTGLLNGIEEMQEKLFTHLGNLGGDIVAGLKRGISGAWDDLMAGLRGLIMQIPEGVRNLLGIASPSKVMAGIGYQIVSGLAAGIADGSPEVEDMMTGVVGRLMSKAQAASAIMRSALQGAGVGMGGAPGAHGPILAGMPSNAVLANYKGQNISLSDWAVGQLNGGLNLPKFSEGGGGAGHEHPIVINLDGRTMASVVGGRLNEQRRLGGAMS